MEIYKLTDLFPKSETYGLISQIRRCAVSIPSNIAEGFRENIARNMLNLFLLLLVLAQNWKLSYYYQKNENWRMKRFY